MNIKQTITYIIFMIAITSCSRSQERNEMTSTQYTKQDILDLHKTVEHFEEEPHYGVRIQSANCNIEILINDKKVFSTNANKIGSVINGAYAPINYGILKSGKQQIKVRMLPPVVDRKTEIKHLNLGNAQLNIEIVADDFMNGESTGEYPVYEWESPKETRFIKEEGIEMPYFIQPELPLYEHEDVFDADVPYDIDGWSKSVNLFTDDVDKLESLTKEALTIYEELRESLQNKKLNNLANLVYEKEKRVAQQFYHSKEDCEENWSFYVADFVHKDFTMMPIKNFKLVFYGNGKMVGLELLGPLDQWDSALWSRYIKEGKNYYSITFYPFLLHRPKPGAKLEVI